MRFLALFFAINISVMAESLDLKAFKEVKFNTRNLLTFLNIDPNKTSVNEDGEIIIEVDSSSSPLIFAFEDEIIPESIAVEWKLYDVEKEIGRYHLNAEKMKKGDDFYLRVGLILSGERREFSWPIRAIAENFHWLPKIEEVFKNKGSKKLPSGKMIMFVDDFNLRESEIWDSPYEPDHVEMRSSKTQYLLNDWQLHQIDLSEIKQFELINDELHYNDLKIVGLWIMSDGDQTGAKFKIKIRDITID